MTPPVVIIPAETSTDQTKSAAINGSSKPMPAALKIELRRLWKEVFIKNYLADQQEVIEASVVRLDGHHRD